MEPAHRAYVGLCFHSKAKRLSLKALWLCIIGPPLLNRRRFQILKSSFAERLKCLNKEAAL